MTENAHTPGAKTVPEVLSAAADLLEKPKGWTQEMYAADARGEYVAALSNDAVCYCALGAIRRAGGYDHDNSAAAVVLGLHVGDPDVCNWNDAPGRTQAEVVAALREAAARATGAPSHD